MDREKLYKFVTILAFIMLFLFIWFKSGRGQTFESTVTLKNGIFEMSYDRETLDRFAYWHSMERGKKNIFYLPYKWVMGTDEKFVWIEGSYPPLHKFKIKNKKVKLYKYNAIYAYKYDIKKAQKPKFLGAEILKNLDKVHMNFKRDTTKVKLKIRDKLKLDKQVKP